MSVINNPADTVRLKRIINEPKRGIGDATVEKAQRIAEEVGDTLFKVISEADTYASLSGKAKALREFTDMITELADLADSDEGLSLMFDEILDKTGYMAMLEAMGDEGITRIENVNELKSNIIKYTQDNEEATLSGFLEDVALVSDIDNYDADADATVMMTMHSAKGLEFPYVFIVGMEDGIFPSVKTMFDPAEMEEERRIAYVAITRAKKRLFITNASSRMMFGQTMRNRPSRFLEEIPPQYKEELGLSRMKPTSVSSSPVHSSAPSKPQYSATSKVTMSSPKPTAVGAGSKQSFRAGDAVMHKIFGKGMVLSATPMGNDTLLEIAFETKGTKKIMANFTKLDKVN